MARLNLILEYVREIQLSVSEVLLLPFDCREHQFIALAVFQFSSVVLLDWLRDFFWSSQPKKAFLKMEVCLLKIKVNNEFWKLRFSF